MNTTARLLPIAAILSALMVFSGCSTIGTARSTPAKAPVQVTVVESSKGLELTPELLADLRRSVAKYLAEQGYGQEGEYLVKVNLTPDQPEDTGQWVVMRITNQPARTFTLLAAYPGADDFYPYDHYGYYNYGYPSYARYGYYDPLDFGWGYGGYYPPATVTPPRAHQPGDKRAHRPPGTRSRWDGNRPEDGRPRSNERPPRTDSPRSGSGDHGGNAGSTGRHDRGGYNPPPSPSYSPPAAQSYSPPPAAQPSPQVNSDSGRHTPRTEER